MSSPLQSSAAADTRASTDATKPRWMRWFCVDDDLFWDGCESTCWFCGSDGTTAPAPAFTSQHGFGPELVA